MKTKKSELRNQFKENGIGYELIGSKSVGLLVSILREELEKVKNGPFSMSLCKIRQKDVKYKEDGSLEYLFLRVDSYYFKRREAISFHSEDENGETFIGFAGWADNTNEQPFLLAFERFMGSISNPVLIS